MTKQSCIWLDSLELPNHALRAALIRAAHADIGTEEQEANRSPYIDGMIKDCGLTGAQPWCAAAVNRWCSEAGVARPHAGQASCDVWMTWAQRRGNWKGKTH